MEKPSISFLENKLIQLTEEIPEIECLYKFDVLDDIHVIKILPKEIFESKFYIQKENKLVLDFIQQYPCEGILFITEDEIIDIEDPDKIFKGHERI